MLVQGFDHFVVPVNDVVVAEDFYSSVFGGKIVKRLGLNVRSQSLGPHTFITIAGKRIGVYLQKEERGTPNHAARHPDLFVYRHRARLAGRHACVAGAEQQFYRAG
jgi:catechol 2,3-dioxygenase-like lactoylglutathione lyase family enzyme